MAAPPPVLDLPARLTLPGHAPTPVRLHAVARPRSRRATSALLALAGFWALTPLVFFIPPHLPWALGAFAAGIYFAASLWRGTYVVRGLEASCPRCGAALTVAPGTRIAASRKMVCLACHHESRLEIAEPPHR